MADIFEISGRIHSTSQEEVVTTSSEIIDEGQNNKKQSEINADVQSELNAHDEAINAPSTGLEARVETLEEQVAFSGDFQTANTPADVVSGSGKITTANAVAAIAEQLKAEVGYYPCTTAAGTAAKVITASDAPNYVLTVGGSVKVKMTNKNTAENPTLKIGNAEAKPLYYGASRASSSNTWEAGEVIEVYYDGENLMANNVEGGGGDGVFDISAYNASGEPLAPAVYDNLTVALGASGANVPASKRKGGMSVKFIQGTEQSSDNKYVEYFLTKDEWSASEADWQKMNLEEEVNQLGQKVDDLIVTADMIDGGTTIIEEIITPTVVNGEYKTQTINSTDITVSTNANFSYLTVYNVTAGEKYRVKHYAAVVPSGYKQFFIFAVNDTTASINESNLADYITEVDSEEHIYDLVAPTGTKKIFITVKTANLQDEIIKKITDSKKLEWLSVEEENLATPLKNKINNPQIQSVNATQIDGSVVPLEYVDKTIVFTDGKYPVHSRNSTNYSYNTNASFSTIEVDDVSGGDVLKVKLAVLAQPAAYNQYFVFAANSNKTTINETDIADYVTLVDSENFIYDVTIPQGTSMLLSTVKTVDKGNVWVKEIETQKGLDWLLLKDANLNSTVNELISKNAKAYFDGYNKAHHLWESIKRPIDFAGKTLVAFGDSITYGISSPGLTVITNKYIKLFCDYANVGTLVNKAKSGTTFVHRGGGHDICDEVTAFSGNADIIWIAGGTNDFTEGSVVGEWGDDTYNTVFGSLKIICEYLTTNYPNAIVIFITPISRTKDISAYPDAIASMDDYRSAIYDVATYYGYNVVNGLSLGMPREQGGWNNTMIEDSDGVHPTALGHALYARSLAGKLL